jgi:chitin synthase
MSEAPATEPKTQEMLHVITKTSLTPAPIVPLDEDVLFQQIKSRFTTGDVYTRLGPRSIIAVNPWKSVPSNSVKGMPGYTVDVVSQSATQPHVYELATNAYIHLAATGEDQCVIMSGQSGSGKTEAARMTLQHLLYLRYGLELVEMG